MRKIKCICCGFKKATSLFKRVDGRCIYFCEFCGHKFVDFKNYNTNSFYDEKYFKGDGSMGYEDYDYRPAVDFFWQSKLIDLVSQNNKYLDIGCATGKTLEMTSLLGIDSYGVEISEYASRVARSKGLNVFNGELKNYQSDKKFGAVSLWEIIEHVNDPVNLLEKAKSFLTEDGWLFISVPDSTNQDKDWSGYKGSLEHISYFTQDSLKYLLKKVFGENCYLVKPFTDGVSNTLLAVVKSGTRGLRLSKLEEIIDVEKEASNKDEKVIKFSLAKGLMDPHTAINYFKNNTIDIEKLSYPEKDIVEGLRLMAEHRLGSIDLFKKARPVSTFKKITSPFWECYSYMLAEECYRLNLKNKEINVIAKRNEADAFIYRKSYENVIKSRGWKIVLAIRKILRKN